MTISEIELSIVPTLKPGDTAAFAMDRMVESRLFDLPVADAEGIFLGMISYEALEECSPDDRLDFLKEEWKQLSVLQEDVLLRALHMMEQDMLTAIAVVDDQNRVIACLQCHDFLKWLSSQSFMAQPGGLLSLRVASNNYSLSEIARIAESNNASILNVRIGNAASEGDILIHLKFNVMDLTYVMATFERFGYRIERFTHQSHLGDFYMERYDSLMRYLDI
jgi:acetoin utilization protein AcuB